MVHHEFLHQFEARFASTLVAPAEVRCGACSSLPLAAARFARTLEAVACTEVYEGRPSLLSGGLDIMLITLILLMQVVIAMMAAQLLQWRVADAPDVAECAFAAVPTLSILTPQSCADPLQSAACSLAEVLG